MKVMPFYMLLGLILWAGIAKPQKITYSADRMSKKKGSSKILLENNVKLSQGDMLIYCTSADYSPKANAFFARGNVEVTKGTDLRIYSETLDYDGQTKKGKFRKNVRLVDQDDTLYTDYLDFNSEDNSGYFYNGGKIVDSTAVLESKTGYYYPDESSYFFKDSVRVTNEDYQLHSDTLKYNLETEKAIVFGPTEIFGDSSYIYCEDGWYDMQHDIAQIKKNALVRRKQQELTGDSLFFDQERGYGRGFSDVTFRHLEKQLLLKGNYGEYYDDPRRAMMTDSALFIDASNSDDSLFLHADTLRLAYDSTEGHEVLKAYYHAQIFKTEIQARSDSITYTESDSIIRLHKNPIVWNDSNQITAQFIAIHTRGENLDFVEMEGNPMLVAYEGEDRYNQLKGDYMKGYFRDNELYRLDAENPATSVYYARDEDDKLIGMNTATCEKMSIFLHNQKVVRVKFHSKPKGVLFPMKLVPESERFLEHFKWKESLRPRSKDDIFIWQGSDIKKQQP